MEIYFYKYDGCGNDFILIDKRGSKNQYANELIKKLCHRRFGIGADGIIFIEEDKTYDFYMNFFNSDGNITTMCGNGGRCAVAFWGKKNLISSNEVIFRAVDGIHKAFIEENYISLEMKEVESINILEEGIFLDTGSPHLIKFVKDVEELNVCLIAKKIRYNHTYFQVGVNVNFVQIVNQNTLKVRTYERGVEGETFSCGTGAAASAIAAFELNKINSSQVNVQTLGGNLKVNFCKKKNEIYKEIWLSGEAKLVFEGQMQV